MNAERTKPKKALIVTSIWGFVAKFEQEDVRILQKLGYEVHFASNQTNPIYLFSGDVYEQMGIIYHDIHIWQSPLGIKPNARSIKEVRKIIEQEGVELVHCHTPTGGLVARLAARKTNARVIYTVHGFHFYQGSGVLHNLFYRSIENFLGRFTDDIVTINREDFEAAKRISHRGSVSQIPGAGLDRKYYYLPSEEERQRAREALGYQEDEFIIVQVGEIRENKNPEVILRALHMLRNTGTNIIRIRYLLVGAGKQEEKIRKLVQDLVLTSNVRFCGYQEDVRPYLMAADLMTFPSIREGLGMAALEAMSTGVPVLAADNRGTREYMRHGINGYVCQSNSPREHADWIRRMMEERSHWADRAIRKRVRLSTLPFEKSRKSEVMEIVYRLAKKSGKGRQSSKTRESYEPKPL